MEQMVQSFFLCNKMLGQGQTIELFIRLTSFCAIIVLSLSLKNCHYSSSPPLTPTTSSTLLQTLSRVPDISLSLIEWKTKSLKEGGRE